MVLKTWTSYWIYPHGRVNGSYFHWTKLLLFENLRYLKYDFSFHGSQGLLVSQEYIRYDNESTARAAAGRNLFPNWTVWFSFTTLSHLCYPTNTLTVNPSRSATSREDPEGIFPCYSFLIVQSEKYSEIKLTALAWHFKTFTFDYSALCYDWSLKYKVLK